MISSLRSAASQPTCGSGLSAFRLGFGLLMAAASVRFWSYGWIDEIFLNPEFHFSYAGFSWVQVPPAGWLKCLFMVQILSALCVAFGLYTRAAAGVFFVAFTYVELLEKAAYLNHYYLVSILALLLAVLPDGGAWSLRANGARKTVPIGAYWLLRAQVGLVYFFAGIAKLNADWLFRAEPLRTWLSASADVPVIGQFLALESTAYFMSWGGALFDLTIWIWLLWPRTRLAALLVAFVFHVFVWLLFPIGMFSWIMCLCLTTFLDPRWALKASEKTEPRDVTKPRLLTHYALAGAALWIALQVVIPLRHLAQPGPVNWTEEGFRFSWRVMLIEKTGTLEYRVVTQNPAKTYRHFPRDHLTELQHKMLTTNPDMIREYAQHLGREVYGSEGATAQVYADSFVSFNGRLSVPYIDPTIDLAAPDVRTSALVLPHPALR